MKARLPYFAALAALLFFLAAPSPSIGQADDPAVPGLLKEVAAQQVTLADNQTKIDEKLAAIAEDIRQARIFASRGK